MKHLRVIVGNAGAAVLAGLSVLHVYWAAGGRRGQHAVVPTSGGRPLLAPSTAATVAVAAALATASGLYLGATARCQPRWVYRVGARGAATVLIALGDRGRPPRRFPEAFPGLGVRPARHVRLFALVRFPGRRGRIRCGVTQPRGPSWSSSFDECSGDSCLELGWVSLDTGGEISGAAAQDRVESEQHERGERVEQLRRRGPQPGREVHETAAVEQVQPAPGDRVALEVASNLDVRVPVHPVDVDLAIAVADVDQDRAVGHPRAVAPHLVPRRIRWRSR